jgi:hypothetical protein
LHSIEKLITVLERASLVHCTEFSFRVISDPAPPGQIVEFPNRYELSQVKGKFGGCFMD